MCGPQERERGQEPLQTAEPEQPRKSGGWARSRADERGPESDGSLTLMCSHLRSVFKYRFLALVPQDSDSESWGMAQACAF